MNNNEYLISLAKRVLTYFRLTSKELYLMIWLRPFPYHHKASFLLEKPSSAAKLETEHFLALQLRSAHATRTFTSLQVYCLSAC